MLCTYIFMPYYWFWLFLFTLMKSFYLWSQRFLFRYWLFKFGSLWDFDWLFRFYFVSLYFSHGSVNWLLFFSSILLFSVWLHWPKFDIIFFSDYYMFYLLRLTFSHILDCLYLDTGGIISVLTLTDLLSNVNKVKYHDMFLWLIFFFNSFKDLFIRAILLLMLFFLSDYLIRAHIIRIVMLCTKRYFLLLLIDLNAQ